MLSALFRITTLLIISGLCMAGCAGTAAPPTGGSSGEVTSTPVTGIAQIDRLMQSTMSGSIAHNAPSSMHVDDTVEIQMLVSPSISPADLKQRITATGSVTSASLDITPRMKAELTSADPDAVVIQPVHDNAVQLLTNTEATEWKWLVTAKKEGDQRLYLTAYRLIVYDGQEYWRQVKAYEDVINVDVTLSQRLAGFDWKWLIGLILAGILFPIVVSWWRKRQAA